MSHNPEDCKTCKHNGNCESQDTAKEAEAMYAEKGVKGLLAWVLQALCENPDPVVTFFRLDASTHKLVFAHNYDDLNKLCGGLIMATKLLNAGDKIVAVQRMLNTIHVHISDDLMESAMKAADSVGKAMHSTVEVSKEIMEADLGDPEVHAAMADPRPALRTRGITDLI